LAPGVRGSIPRRILGHRLRARRSRVGLFVGSYGGAHAVSLKLDRITLREIRMPLVSFFEPSFGRTYDRRIILVEVHADGAVGWGEATAGENPFYNEEPTDTAWHIIKEFVAPRVLNVPLESAGEIRDRTRHIRGH